MFGIKDKSLLKSVMKASTIGLNLVLATAVGLIIGLFLDKWLGSAPWFTIIFLIIGIVAGFREAIRMVYELNRQFDKNEEDSE